MSNCQNRLRAIAGQVGACVGIAGCSIIPAREVPSSYESVHWPPDDPRVRLEHIYQVRGDLEPSRTRPLSPAAAGEALFVRPYGVAWAGRDLLVTDPGARTVLRLGADGKVARTVEGAFRNPIGVAACETGVYVSDAEWGAVVWLDASLRQVEVVASGLDRPTGLGCWASGFAVVETGQHRVVLVEQDGTRSVLGGRGHGPGELNFPTAIATRDDQVWVGDVLNFRVQRFDARSGAPQLSFGRLGDSSGEMPRLKGIAIDPAGRVWVSDAYLDEVAAFAGDGTFLMAVGGSGAAPGRLSFPAGVAFREDGLLAVADSLNRRIQLLRLLDLDNGAVPGASADVEGPESPGAPAGGPCDDERGLSPG